MLSALAREDKTGHLRHRSTCRNVFVSVCGGKQQSCLAAGWQMRENRKCDLRNNIWIRRRDSHSNGCLGLCNWNSDSLTAPFVKGLVHPNYRETFSYLTLMVSVHADSFGFICPDFEISVSENYPSALIATMEVKGILFVVREALLKNIYRVQQDRVFPESFHEDYFFGRK